MRELALNTRLHILEMMRICRLYVAMLFFAASMFDLLNRNLSLAYAPAVCIKLSSQVPDHLEDYIHRVGRTGRAGKLGAKSRAFLKLILNLVTDVMDCQKALCLESPFACELPLFAKGRLCLHLHSTG